MTVRTVNLENVCGVWKREGWKRNFCATLVWVNFRPQCNFTHFTLFQNVSLRFRGVHTFQFLSGSNVQNKIALQYFSFRYFIIYIMLHFVDYITLYNTYYITLHYITLHFTRSD